MKIIAAAISARSPAARVFTCKTQFYKWLISYNLFGICFGIEGVHIDRLCLDPEFARDTLDHLTADVLDARGGGIVRHIAVTFGGTVLRYRVKIVDDGVGALKSLDRGGVERLDGRVATLVFPYLCRRKGAHVHNFPRKFQRLREVLHGGT